jgi:hypothetical protein
MFLEHFIDELAVSGQFDFDGPGGEAACLVF